MDVEATVDVPAAVATVEVAAADWRVDGTVMEPVGETMEELPNGYPVEATTYLEMVTDGRY